MPNRASIKQPSSYVPKEVEGLEKALEPIRKDLMALPWLEDAFGRARIMKQAGRNSDFNVPKVYNGKGEYLNVMPGNDNSDAYAFFLGRGGFNMMDEAPNVTHPLFEKRVDLIVWCNLKRVSPERDYDFRHLLINDVLDILGKRHGVQIFEVYDEVPAQIFSGFALTEINQDKLYYPYAGFRITFDMTFLDCMGNRGYVQFVPNAPAVKDLTYVLETEPQDTADGSSVEYDIKTETGKHIKHQP